METMIEPNAGSEGKSGKKFRGKSSDNLNWDNSISFMVVHELKTPLSTIRTHAAYLKKNIASMNPKDIGDKIQIIEAQAVRIGSMLKDILALGQAVAPRIGINRERINICSFLTALKSEIELQFNRSHHINFTAQVDQKELFIDCDLLRNIFTNLLVNAIKFSPDKTDVWMELCDAEGSLEVTVKDEGMGIDEKEMLKIFHPFQRGSNATGIDGTGLGLCIVKKAIDALEGSIKVSSSPGRGAVFKVIIPNI